LTGGRHESSVSSTSDAISALEMYELALSLVEANGVSLTLGVSTFKEYRFGSVTIHYLPKSGHLDVWDRRKVLSVERARGGARVIRYVPGYWEDELEAAVAKSPSKR
jgi:hypothetical protein